MNFEIWLALVATTTLLSISPGPGALVAINYGLNYGIRSSLVGVLGLQLGGLIQMVVVVLGLGAILATSAYLFALIKWLGVAYLIYFGIRKWREGASPEKFSEGGALSQGKALIQSVLVNITNPKGLVFYMALLPQFIDPERPQAIQFAVIAATILVIDFLVMAGYCLLAVKVRPFMQNRKAWQAQNRLTGSFLIGAGLVLAGANN